MQIVSLGADYIACVVAIDASEYACVCVYVEKYTVQ